MERTYRFGDYTLEVQAHCLRRAGHQIHLRPKAFETLLYLIERRDCVVKKGELLDALWPDIIVTENTLSQCIDAIRKALGDSAREPDFIQTIPRIGFKFIAEIIALDSDAVDSAQDEHNSIAVLPFINLNDDPEQEYFADGMTETLIAELAKIKALPVISRTSAMHYKKTDKPLSQIAQELNVDLIIEGSVLRTGGRVRIIAQLIQARTDRHLWSGTYERDLQDILSLQSDMARAIAGEVQVKITPHESKSRLAHYPVEPTALDAYLKGRYFLSRRTREALEKSLTWFNLASQLKPDYPEAYAGIAEAQIILCLMGEQAGAKGMPRAAAMAGQALKLDSTLAEAHTALAYVKMHYEWDWPGAEKEFKQALDLKPNDATAHHFYAMFLISQTRFNEALREMECALKLDPLSPIINTHHAWLYYAQRSYDQAIVRFQHVIKLTPRFFFAHYWLGMVYLQKSMVEKAEASFERAASIWPDNPRVLAWKGFARASAGKTDEALDILNRLIQLSEERYVPGYGIAMIYLGLGDRERLFMWLEKACQEHEAMMVMLKMPIYDSVRSDPRFLRLLDKVGLKP